MRRFDLPLREAGQQTKMRAFALSEVPEAIRYVREHHVRGKVVITV